MPACSNNDASTDWVCLDFDKLPGITDIEDTLKEIDELRDVSYIIQYASSHGLDGKFSAHLFMLLENPIGSRALEAWLTWLNLTETVLSRQLRLNPAGLSIAWPLDPVPARNTQIIYIATPEFVGMKDPVEGKRIKIVNHRHDALSISSSPKENVLKLRRKKLRELRAEAGLADVQYKAARGHTTLSGVSATITEIVDTNDKFVRVNVNGGDSAAYWFWKHDPTLLYSFKDETEIYKLEDLDPEFYARYINSSEFKSLTDRQLVAFIEQGTTSGYRLGEYDPRENAFYMNNQPALEPWLVSKDKFNELLKFMGFKPTSFITPPGSVVFDPKDIGPRFNDESCRVNRFLPSKFMYAKPGSSKVPPTIARLLTSVLGPSEIVEHFVKWFAVLFAERTQVGTSWLFQGTQGSGKSMLVHHVLEPLVGESNFSLITPSDLNDRFNDYIAEKLLVFIDEADLNKTGGGAMLSTRIKSMVGNRRAAVRKMYRAVTQIENHANLIMATNRMNAVDIPMDDRRSNVGDYQLKSMVAQNIDTNRFVKDLTRELDAFAGHLMWLAPQVNSSLVTQPLDTLARTQIQENTLPSSEHVTQLLKAGDLESLFGYLSKDVRPGTFEISAQYEKVLTRWLWSSTPFVLREDLITIYKFHVPHHMRTFEGPGSEGHFLGRQGFVKTIRKIDAVATRVYIVDFARSDELKRAFPLEGGASHIRRIK